MGGLASPGLRTTRTGLAGGEETSSEILGWPGMDGHPCLGWAAMMSPNPVLTQRPLTCWPAPWGFFRRLSNAPIPHGPPENEDKIKLVFSSCIQAPVGTFIPFLWGWWRQK